MQSGECKNNFDSDLKSPNSAIGGAAITEKDFRNFQKLINDLAGIYLSEAKKSLLVGRLSKRLRTLGMKSYREYYEYVLQDRTETELVCMLDCICTNETSFFREPQHFEYLDQAVFPHWMNQAALGEKNKKIRVWSAACSTGEEPYSLAMALLNRFAPAQGWEIEIIASDLSTKVLEQARQGVWSMDKKDNIPGNFLKTFMLRGTGAREGTIAAGNALRSVIKFIRMNLNQDSYPLTGNFDLVFCRNVLIYFDVRTKEKVAKNLLGMLAPEGHLFMGHSESLPCQVKGVMRVAPNVYKKTA